MKTAVFTGSFNPITAGHIQVALKALAAFDKLYVAVLVNEAKHYKASLEERKSKVEAALSGYNIEVVSSDGTAVELCKRLNADYIVRGIRNGDDYIYEAEMAAYNRAHGAPDTVYFLADNIFKDVSSTKARAESKEI